MKQRATTTDQLARVIQFLQMGKRTGLLTVEHGTTFEEGVVAFVNGQITEAKVGPRQGRNAMNWLYTWGLCRFIFIPMPPPVPLLPAPSNTDPPRSRITQKLPAIHSDTDPLQQHPTQKQPEPPADNNHLRSRATQKLASIKLVKPVHNEQNGQTPPPPTVTPYLTRPADEALYLLEQHQPSRSHKHLLLLIDGRRTTLDLIRVMGRSPDEMSRLLGDLRYLGLIGLRV